jgi:hypothetical protein
MVGADKRVKIVAQDIVEHFESTGCSGSRNGGRVGCSGRRGGCSPSGRSQARTIRSSSDQLWFFARSKAGRRDTPPLAAAGWRHGE